MEISTKIAYLKPMVGFDKDKDIRDTLEINDFKRAIEFAERRLCEEAKITLRSVIIPYVQDSKYFSISLVAQQGFDIISPKAYFVLSSDGGMIEITEEDIEDVLTNGTNIDLDIYRIALRRFGSTKYIQTNIDIGSQPPLGLYNSIASFPAANQVTMVDDNGAANYYLINLSKANEGKYSSALATASDSGHPPTLTLDISVQTDTKYLWLAGDYVYLATSLPYIMIMVFQGMPGELYHDTYSTIPVDGVYLDKIDPIALEYLYSVLQARSDKYYQKYMNQLKLSDRAITQAKKIANRRSGLMKIKPYNLFVSDYGR